MWNCGCVLTVVWKSPVTTWTHAQIYACTLKEGKKNDPARIRTWNPLIRSQMPYPLGHRATQKPHLNYCVFILLYYLHTRMHETPQWLIVPGIQQGLRKCSKGSCASPRELLPLVELHHTLRGDIPDACQYTTVLQEENIYCHIARRSTQSGQPYQSWR